MAFYLIQNGSLKPSPPVVRELSPSGILLVNFDTPGGDPFGIGASSDAANPGPPEYPTDTAPDCEMRFENAAVSASLVMGWSNLATDLTAKSMVIAVSYSKSGPPVFWLRLNGELIERELDSPLSGTPSIRVFNGHYQLMSAAGDIVEDITPDDIQAHISTFSPEWPDGTPMEYDATIMAPLAFGAAESEVNVCLTTAGGGIIDVVYDGTIGASQFWEDLYLASEST